MSPEDIQESSPSSCCQDLQRIEKRLAPSPLPFKKKKKKGTCLLKTGTRTSPINVICLGTLDASFIAYFSKLTLSVYYRIVIRSAR